MLITPPPSLRAGTSFMNAVRALSLTTNLRVCLEAGDVLSYPGSGQVWTDLSGSADHFNLGATSGSEASDPTFNGRAGNNSSGEYFSMDGGDFFTLAQSAPAWQSSFHKANAKLTVLGWYYVNNITSTSPTQEMFGFGDATNSSDGTDSFGIGQSSSLVRAIGFGIVNGSGTAYAKRSDSQANNNAWNFLGVSADFSTGTVMFQLNATTDTFTSQSLSSPSATDSHVPMVIGAHAGDGNKPDTSGCRYASVAIWDISISAANMLAIYNATKGRYGL